MSEVESISTKNHATIFQLNCEKVTPTSLLAKSHDSAVVFSERYVWSLRALRAFLSVISTTQGTVVHPGTVMIHPPE